MSFTRFHDDPCRVQKYLEETTNIGNYNLNVPGNGIDMPFFNDPHVRMQKWGANLSNNIVNIDSDLRGLTRGLNRDSNELNNYQKNSVNLSSLNILDYFIQYYCIRIFFLKSEYINCRT